MGLLHHPFEKDGIGALGVHRQHTAARAPADIGLWGQQRAQSGDPRVEGIERVTREFVLLSTPRR